MVNLYRFCIAILFASLSFSFASTCRIERVIDKSSMIDQPSGNCGSDIYDWPYGRSCLGSSSFEESSDGLRYRYALNYVIKEGSSNGPIWAPAYTDYTQWYDYKFIEKEICDDPKDPEKPNLDDWANCKKGKDHGFSWITIGDGNGEGESRFKQEFWACDDPDIWIVYNHPPEDKPTEPTDPTDPDKPTDPTDPDKPGEGGEGGDDGSGNGNDGGSDGGNDNGSNNGGDQNGTGLTQGEVQEAVEGALDSKGQEL